jgi:elongation factor Tu
VIDSELKSVKMNYKDWNRKMEREDTLECIKDHTNSLNDALKSIKPMKSEKKHINLGTIGHAGHGKTTLMAAIALATIKQKKPKATKPKQTLDYSCIEYETDKLHISHFDCPGDDKYTKNMFNGLSQVDTVILVVDASNGPMPQTREHIILANCARIKSIIVFLNKIDLVNDLELCDLIEMETRDMLTQYEFNGDNVQVIRGSALKALQGQAGWEMKNLIGYINKLAVPERENKSFLMPISKVIPRKNGVIVTGTIKSGVVNESDEILIHGKNPQKVICKSIESFKKPIKKASAGDNIAILIENLSKDDVERGQLLSKEKEIKIYSKFEAETYILSKDEGGRRTPFIDGYIPQFYFKTFDSPGKIKILNKDKKSITPGENANIQVELSNPFSI